MKLNYLFLFIFMLSINYVYTQEKKNLSAAELMFEYYDDSFKPFHKQKWFTTLTFSVEDDKLRSENEIIGFGEVIQGTQFNYDIKIKGGYSIGNYNFVGLGVSHGNDQSEGLGIIATDTLRSESNTNRNAISPFIRTYYPLSKNHRFSFFNEVKMDFGFGNTDTKRYKGPVQTEEFESNTFVFGIGISPGITFFAMESFAFEIQLDVLGYEYKKVRTTNDSGESFSSDSHNVNFTLDLLSMNFGLAYYFGAKK